MHGCFWHRCPRCALGLPKSNAEYWSDKFERNVERGRRKEGALLDMGWKVHTIWECDTEVGCKQAEMVLAQRTPDKPC